MNEKDQMQSMPKYVKSIKRVLKKYEKPIKCKLNGDSRWLNIRIKEGEIESYPSHVKISKIYQIIDLWDNKNSDFETKDGRFTAVSRLYVKHDQVWDIYNDSGFIQTLSKELKRDITFTEEKLQSNGLAHMHGDDQDKKEGIYNYSHSAAYHGFGINKKKDFVFNRNKVNMHDDFEDQKTK